MDKFLITFYGVGGSTSSSSPERAVYGSNTSCALVQAGEHYIILDMGSGLLQLCRALDNTKRHYNILLGHFHYDHIEGFPFLKLSSDSTATIWANGKDGKNAKQLLTDFMSEPYFPVSPSIYDKNVSYKESPKNGEFDISSTVKVETMQLNHPGGVTGYKITYNNKSLVYLLDFEHSPIIDKNLLQFCQNANLVVYDSFFTEEEYSSGKFVGWGHSTHTQGTILAKAANIQKLVFSHHANWRTDRELANIEKAFPNYIMAREGMVITI